MKFFETAEAILNIRALVDDSYVPKDPALFVSAGKFKASDRGRCEVGAIEPGSRVDVQAKPNGRIDLVQGGVVHATLTAAQFTLGAGETPPKAGRMAAPGLWKA